MVNYDKVAFQKLVAMLRVIIFFQIALDTAYCVKRTVSVLNYPIFSKLHDSNYPIED